MLYVGKRNVLLISPHEQASPYSVNRDFARARILASRSASGTTRGLGNKSPVEKSEEIVLLISLIFTT